MEEAYGLPLKEVPPGKVFDIRYYPAREWVLIYLDRETYDSIRKACEEHKIDVKKAIYGSLIRIREVLK
jgi:hypothetical protein